MTAAIITVAYLVLAAVTAKVAVNRWDEPSDGDDVVFYTIGAIAIGLFWPVSLLFFGIAYWLFGRWGD